MTEEIELKHGLGRKFAADPNDNRYLLPRRAIAPPRTNFRYWAAPPAMDQGATSSCVGHGWNSYLRSSPVRNTKNIPDPYLIYNEAQKIDEWPGTETVPPTYEGTSVRAGAKYLKAQGFISSYHWAFDGATAFNHLLSDGPVVVGWDFYSGMMSTDKYGFIYPKGRLIGGHCVNIIGINTTAKCPDGRIGFCTGVNSWSRDWGAIGGRFRISLEDFDMLTKQQGEVCVAHEILKPIPTV